MDPLHRWEPGGGSAAAQCRWLLREAPHSMLAIWVNYAAFRVLSQFKRIT